MANVDRAQGLKPVGHLFGLPWNQGVRRCYVSASYGTSLFIGDPVDYDTTLANKDSTLRHQSVIIATAGNANPILGVIVGIEPNRDDLTKQYIPLSTGGYVYVCMDPYVIFRIQDDGDGTVAAVWTGQNANLASGTGNTLTGLSGWELDADGPPGTTDDDQLHILNLADIEDNEVGDFAEWDVLINAHRLKPTSTAGAIAVGSLGVTAT